MLARFERELRSIVVRRGYLGSRCSTIKTATEGALHNGSVARIVVLLYCCIRRVVTGDAVHTDVKEYQSKRPRKLRR